MVWSFLRQVIQVCVVWSPMHLLIIHTLSITRTWSDFSSQNLGNFEPDLAESHCRIRPPISISQWLLSSFNQYFRGAFIPHHNLAASPSQLHLNDHVSLYTRRFWIWCHLIISDYRYRYTNEHGKTTNGMNKESTCKMTSSPTDECTKHAKLTNATNKHLREQMSLSSLPTCKQGITC